MDRASESPGKQKRPSFFKVLVQDFSTRLQIPPAFIKKFAEHLPNKAILEAYLDKSTEVEVEKLGRKAYFSKGWREFVEDNNLEHGDFLVFKYLADLKLFKITVYGKTCCVKQLNERTKEPKEDQRSVQDQGKRKCVEEDDDLNKDEVKCARRNGSEFNRSKACGRNVIVNDSDSSDHDQIGDLKQSTCKQRTKAHTIEDKKALRRSTGKCRTVVPDKLIEFRSEYPFFQVTLKYYNYNYLHIPIGFFKKHMMKENQEIKFQISKKIWSMDLQVMYTNKGTVREAKVRQGWKKFARENDLEMGHVCIFEMIKSDDFVFRVHVYR